jgi:hypothetical protein
MSQPLGQRSIVCNEDQSLAIQIKSTRWMQALRIGEQIAQGKSTAVIVQNRQMPGWLIEHNVPSAATERHWATIHGNPVPHGIDLDTHLGDHSTIDPHSSLTDQPLAGSARSNARPSQCLL